MSFSLSEQGHLFSKEEGIEWSHPLLVSNDRQIEYGTLSAFGRMVVVCRKTAYALRAISDTSE